MYVTFVGDVHGCYHTLVALLEKIPKEQNQIILLGDLINKGKYAYEAFQLVKNQQIELLMGNHEYYCINRNKLNFREAWFKQGGKETMESIRNSLQVTDDQSVQVILAQMSFFFEKQKLHYIFQTAYGKRIIATHGGINDKLYEQCRQNVELCLRSDIRQPHSYLFNKQPLAQIENTIQVIGHQPKEHAPRKMGNNFYLDSGCVYPRKGMHYLSAVRFNLLENRPPKIFRQVNIEP